MIIGEEEGSPENRVQEDWERGIWGVELKQWVGGMEKTLRMEDRVWFGWWEVVYRVMMTEEMENGTHQR